ncbi:MAG: OB-fold domain-containing protein [Gammaproteobacteria bacterium]|nr:OB-fold domain-containing protein [Gammaproteobacteria bacterium]MCP5201925.1 OB-fold domain-containing protein [Gammaproteobacteria bacterium]
MTDTPARPEPPPSALSAAYWEGLRRGELLLQVCANCGVPRHYPRLLCCECYHDGVHWCAASGRGRVHSWTVAHYAYHPAFAAELPYTLVTVDLEEGPRALGRWYGGALAIGLPVRVRIVQREAGPELCFEVADAAAS